MKGERMIKGFLVILSGKVGKILVGVATTPILIRFLNETEYGNYAFMMSIFGLLLVPINGVVFDGARKFLSEDRFSHIQSQIITFYIKIIIIVVSVFMLFIFSLDLSSIIQRTLPNKFVGYFYVLIPILFLRASVSLARSSLLGIGLEKFSEPLEFLRKFSFSVTAIYLAYAGFGTLGVLFSHIIAAFIVTAISIPLLSKKFSYKLSSINIPNTFPRKNLLTFSLLNIVLMSLIFSMRHIDVIFLRLLLEGEQTAYYKAALVIAEFLWFVPLALQITLVHSTSKLWDNNKIDDINNMSRNITKYNLIFTLLLVVGLAVLADEFVNFYFGVRYAASATPLLLLLPGVLGFALARPIFAIGQGKGDVLPLVYATGASALLNIVLNILLIPRFGMTGAAIATSIGYGSMAIFHIFISIKKIGFNPIKGIPIFRIGFSGLITLYVLDKLNSQVITGSISLVTIPVIGGLVYITLLLLFGVITRSQYNTVVDMVSLGE
ncbi:polysaccharide biosynthesis C-terminal domain-containing protein [Natrinema hispanicum]|uniref:Membrane protein involved in the export of O-antigen and teichoic acid n=1 Tax=Natrinema hispanicum TaxID=392421 RepID=A0A1G6YJJ3_9EURY|nr:polysaccharide biosynthesis C-terminal domain-containing protein [Natrinema hispanicum]SDD90461.1 Membrane protein involved in the export of O-antigen and teichoic acid [Natrinema hispanicum]